MYDLLSTENGLLLFTEMYDEDPAAKCLTCSGTCHPDPGTLNLRGEMPVRKSPAEPPAVHRKTPAQHKKLPCEGRFFERGSTLLAAAAPAFKTCNNQ